MYSKEKNRFFRIVLFMLTVMGMAVAVLHTSVNAKQRESVIFGRFPQSEVMSVSNELETAVFDENGDAFVGDKKYRRVGYEGYYRYFLYEPLQWDVIADSNGYLTLMTKAAVACVPYDNQEREYTDTGIQALMVSPRTWENSSVRSWLNGYGMNYNANQCDFSYEGAGFLNASFDDHEKQAIIKTTTGKNSNDLVYLLSEAEARKLLAEKELRKKQCSPYAQACGAYIYMGDSNRGNVSWFLRDAFPGIIQCAAVDESGNFFRTSYSEADMCVCPVIRVKKGAVNVSQQPKQAQTLAAAVIESSGISEGKKVTVTYDKVFGADGYEVSCYEDRSSTKKIKTYRTSKTTKSFQCNTDGDCCYVRVRAYRKNGNVKLYGAYSSPTKIIFRKSTAKESEWKSWKQGTDYVCPQKNPSVQKVVESVAKFVEGHLGDTGCHTSMSFQYYNLSDKEFEKKKSLVMEYLSMYRSFRNLEALVDAGVSASDPAKSEHTISVRIEIGYGMMEGNSDWYNKVNELADMAQDASDNPAGQIAEYMIWLSENTYYEGALWGAFSSEPVYLSGRGVCAHYAAAFKDFCDASGIPATIVDASVHAFNSVYLGGKWYLIDTTGGYLGDEKENIRNNPFGYVTSFTSPSHYEGKYSKKYLKIAQDITLQSYQNAH